MRKLKDKYVFDLSWPTHSSILKISDFKFLTIRNEFSFNVNKFIIIIIIQNLLLINKSKN